MRSAFNSQHFNHQTDEVGVAKRSTRLIRTRLLLIYARNTILRLDDHYQAQANANSEITVNDTFIYTIIGNILRIELCAQ